jgi:flagellar hook-length control protein FliK
LGTGRAEVDGAGAQAGGDQAAEQEEQAAADGTTAPPADPAATLPGGVVAALWALLTGAARTAPATGGEAAATAAASAPVAAGQVAAGHVDGLPPGLAVARAHGGAAVAHGVRGTQPGAVTEAAASAADAPPVPAAAAPTPPLPASAAVRAAVEALAAAGVQQIGTDPPAPTPGTEEATGSTPIVVLSATTPSTGSADAAPTAAQATATGALPVVAPGGSGGTTADSGSRSGAGTPDDGAAATGAVPTTGQTAPATSSAPVAVPAAATGDAAAQPVGGQIAKQVAVLRGGPDGSHTMTVVLTPDSLGPVEVSVTLSQGTVELTLRGAHEHGRAALLDAVPELRRDLESAGLTCSRLDVDRGNRDGSFSSSQQQAGRPGEQGQGHGQSGRGDRSDRSDGGARPWHRSADTGDGPRATTTRTASGLDVRV